MTPWNNCELPDNSLFPEQYSVRKVIRDSPVSIILLGWDSSMDCDVVIKCFNPSAKGAYLREISSAFDINHPNLVRCLNTFHRTDGIVCIVYEYLAGGNLLDFLQARGKIGLQTIIACLTAILNALVYLNSLNRIHCDIKPENILLRPKADGQADYVLADLGAACFLREAREGHHVTGTPAYMAPERIKDKFYFNSDLYSLGIIAYEMATGKRPFTGAVDKLTQANLSEIPSLAEIQPPVLRDFIDHLLVKNPQQRVSSALLALGLLDKVVEQTNRLDANSALVSESDFTGLDMPFNKGEELVTLYCLHVHGYTLIGLGFPHYVAIFDPLHPGHPFKTVLTSYPLQILGSDSFAYATPSRIQWLALNDFHEWLVKDRLNDLKAWHLENGRLVWGNSFHKFYDDFSGDANIKFGVPNYLFKLEAAIFASGSFVATEGIANNKIVLRTVNAKTEQEWLLDEPVIALGHHDTAVLAVTLGMETGISYTIWCLKTGHPNKKLVLPENISQILCVNGVAFWLEHNKVLRCCGTSLRPQTLTTFAASVFKFAVSYDHRFMVVGYKESDSRLFMTVIKIELSHEIFES